MGKDNLQQHLDNAMYGTPQLKPDEQRKYLGFFRERVDCIVTFDELQRPDMLTLLKKELIEHPGLVITVSSAVIDKLPDLIKLSKELNYKISTTNENIDHHDQNDIAVVVASKDTALHTDVIDIYQKFAAILDTTQSQDKKKGFFDFLSFK